METYKLELERHEDGHLFISATFFRDGVAYRAQVISSGRGGDADSVMQNRFDSLNKMLGMQYHKGVMYGLELADTSRA